MKKGTASEGVGQKGKDKPAIYTPSNLKSQIRP